MFHRNPILDSHVFQDVLSPAPRNPRNLDLLGVSCHHLKNDLMDCIRAHGEDELKMAGMSLGYDAILKMCALVRFF